MDANHAAPPMAHATGAARRERRTKATSATQKITKAHATGAARKMARLLRRVMVAPMDVAPMGQKVARQEQWSARIAALASWIATGS